VALRRAPALLALAPAACSEEGGCRILLIGEGFSPHPSARCRFGAASVPAVYVSATAFAVPEVSAFVAWWLSATLSA
jgi:hypothetical protein